jgi:hypothetical protein
MKKKPRVDELVEAALKQTTEALNEAGVGGTGASDDKSSEAFGLLDEARKSLQDAQANIYMKMPSVYQQLYKDQLATIYNHAHNAIAEVQKLAKRMHEELGK